MFRNTSPRAVRPRDGLTLVVGIVARISGCADQREVSLEDQEDHAREVVTELYDGPVEYRVVATRGKGEALDRPELARVEVMLRSRELDLFVMEDLGRLVRGVEAARLWGLAVDHGIRCIAPHDGCDTADETWEADVIRACGEHVGHNSHTSKRLKQKLMNRFKKNDGACGLPIAGYEKPEGASSYAGWRRDEAATPVIQVGLDLLERTCNCSAVADYFNGLGFAPGPYCRTNTWDGAMVRRYYKNPLLKGWAERGNRRTAKNYSTGRRVSERNPNGPVSVECPHLAHVAPDQFDRVKALLADRNGKLGRKPQGGADPLAGMPRRRSFFPGRSAVCWYCGREFVWGGNGQRGTLMCSGSRQWRCWNSVAFDGAAATAKITAAISDELHRLDGFTEQWADLIEAAARDDGLPEALAQLERDEANYNHQRRNLADAIAKFGPNELLGERLREIDDQGRHLARERRRLERRRDIRPELPGSPRELRALLEETFAGLAIRSYAFADFLRQLVPEFRVHLVRLRDGSHPLPRAKVTLDLSGVLPEAARASGFGELLRRELTLDLFSPPQRERLRAEAAALAATGLRQRDIAAKLPEPTSQPAVQKALVLDHLMREAGAATPYVILREPPDDYPKLRRHRNPKYRFEPLEGYVPPEI